MRFLFLASTVLLACSFAFEFGSNSRTGDFWTHHETWVLLIAGSNGWWNYRHQADICHAYHIVREHGIPASNIITMIYDDIAYNPMNPYPGQIFNQPGGPNVYANVTIDYKGDDITPENIIAILTGNSSAVKGGNGRVLQSNKEDNIFVYFADHGAPGLIAIIDDALYASQINKVVKQMYADKKYNQMVFYIEACESGSIFNSLLPNNINVYAVTAANSTQSSWGYYCDGEIPMMETCLGDEFSIRWMENADSVDLTLEQLELQYKIVREKVQMSHVCRFGDMSIMSNQAAAFMGWEQTKKPWDIKNVRNISGKKSSAWLSRDIPIMSMQHAMEKENDAGRKAKLRTQLKDMKAKREYLDKFIREFAASFVAQDRTAFDNIFIRHPEMVTETECHETVTDAFIHKCFNFGKNPYALKYAYILANMCQQKYSVGRILKHIEDKCSKIEMQNIH